MLIEMGGEMAALSRDLLASPDMKNQLERLATIVSRPKGTVLFRRGDAVLGSFLIRRGKVSLRLDGGSSIYPTRVFSAGSLVGLPATVSGAPYSLTAEVVEDAELAFVPRESMMDFLRAQPRLCLQVMDLLSGEISEIRSALKQTDLTRPGRGAP